jgi:hypothetical protein
VIILYYCIVITIQDKNKNIILLYYILGFGLGQYILGFGLGQYTLGFGSGPGQYTLGFGAVNGDGFGAWVFPWFGLRSVVSRRSGSPPAPLG